MVRVPHTCLLALATAGAVFAAVELQSVAVEHGPPDGPSTLQVLTLEGQALAPVTGVAELYGFEWQWDMSSQRVVCTRGSEQAVLVQDVAFAEINGESVALGGAAPLRHGRDLYLQVPVLADLFAAFGTRRFGWSEDRSAVGLYGAATGVGAVACREAGAATVVSIAVDGPLDYDLTYAFPRVYLELPGAAVKAAEASSVSCGVVDSVDVAKVGDGVQVEVTVSEAVDSPAVAYRAERGALEVTLSPMGRAAALPDSMLYNSSLDDRIKTIVIDAGHGGKDPGATGASGVQEKDLTLKVALKLRDVLEENTDLKVYLTREDDTYLTLAQRTRFANEKGADVFLSVHADAIGGSETRRKQVRGYKVYFLSQAKNEEDKLAAMRENAVIELEDDPKEGDLLQNLISDMVGNEYLTESQDLSIMLVESFAESLKKVRKLHTGVGQANFYVLNGAFMPSILLEMGFVSNPSEEQVLVDEAHQKKMVGAICEAILVFKGKYEGDL